MKLGKGALPHGYRYASGLITPYPDWMCKQPQFVPKQIHSSDFFGGVSTEFPSKERPINSARLAVVEGSERGVVLRGARILPLLLSCVATLMLVAKKCYERIQFQRVQ